MRYLIFLFLFIGCTDNLTEEIEMRLIVGNINASNDSPPIAIDGGECIHLTPDASGGEVGHGFTCTGLFFDSWQQNGNPRFWVGNDGRDREPGTGGIDPQDFKPSVVLLELDYSGSDNTLPASVYAVKKRELLTETLSDGTVQGVIEANDGTIWFVSFGNIININASPNGIATEISRFTVTNANGLAYDDVNNHLLIKVNSDGNIKRYSTAGVLIDSNVITVSAAADQIGYNSYDDLFYAGSGSNGSSGSVSYYKLSDGTSYGNEGYANVTASEGVALVYNPNDGNEYLYYASDAWYHQGAQPNDDYKINAIHKVTKTVVTP